MPSFALTRLALPAAIAVAVATVACSSDPAYGPPPFRLGGGAGGADTTTGVGGYPAAHPDAPMLQHLGGPIVATPKIVPVFFSNNNPSYTGPLTDFLGKLGTSSYWTTVVGEYGVGPATVLPPIVLSEQMNGMLTGDAIAAWLAGKLDANDPMFPPADAETIYVLYYPPGANIVIQGVMSCTEFVGYHESTKLDAAHQEQTVVYAVIPDCASVSTIPLDAFDLATAATSHELVEATTDPVPDTAPAWQNVDDAHLAWQAMFGGEAGDLCEISPSAFTKLPELGYFVQRTWSNQSAQMGHNPCVPELAGEVYFNSIPVMSDDLSVTGPMGTKTTIKGVSIAVGATKTIDVDSFSEGPLPGPWEVAVVDGANLLGGEGTLSLKITPSDGLNGGKQHLTISVLSASKIGFEPFFLFSTLGEQTNVWVGAVGH